jgi:orotate phosphoribosyltransferase
MTTQESAIARTLLTSKSVTIDAQNPYTYSSGIKSPIYCDNRLLISDVSTRKQIVDAFCEQIKVLKPKQIAGVATAGITWGAWIADRLQLPYVYVRPKPKGHGKEKQIEGNFIKDDTILIEDLLSTGGSSVQALDAMRAEAVNVISLQAIFTYGFESAKNLFKEKNISVQTLTNLDRLLDEGIAQKFFTQETKDEVLRWRTDPQNWYKG